MSKADFSMDTDSILGVVGNSSSLVNDASDSSSDALTRFAGLDRIAGQTTRKIAGQMESISGSIDNWRKLLQKGAEGALQYDTEMATAAESIEIPLDFTANNSMDTNQYNAVLIGKLDGESVNAGHKTEKVNDIDETTIAAESLTDISGDQTKLRSYDDTTIIGKSILGNISGDQTQAQTYDDSTSVGNTKLKSIAGDQTQLEEYDDSSRIRAKNLGNISGNQTQAQTYDDSTVIGKSILGSVNTDNKTATSDFDDDAIAAAVEDRKAMDEGKDEILNAIEDSSKEM